METKEKEPVQLSSLEALSDERRWIIESVRKWGGAASDALLDPACQIFKTTEGLIGYKSENDCMIVLGDPVCDTSHWQPLVQAFHAYCHKLGKHAIYVSASESFSAWAMKCVCNISMEFGEELIIDPGLDPREYTGDHGSLVRRKVRHASHEGLLVDEYLVYDKKLENAMKQVGDQWLKNRKGLQIYLTHLNLFFNRLGKRWFYAHKGDQIVGVVVLNQLQKFQGWLLNHLMITLDAPHGTPESLVVKALETLSHEGCHYVTFGAIPGDKLGEIVGLNEPSKWVAQQSFKIAKGLFNLGGRKKFWEKFHPKSQRFYLLFSQKINPKDIVGLLKALNVSF
jgi:lysylphosphatidylglycerol synthetase-like protein (DUF2156 family)